MTDNKQTTSITNIKQALQNRDDAGMKELKLLIPDIEDVFKKKRSLTEKEKRALGKYFLIPWWAFGGNWCELPEGFCYDKEVPEALNKMLDNPYGRKVFYNNLLDLQYMMLRAKELSQDAEMTINGLETEARRFESDNIDAYNIMLKNTSPKSK